MFLTVKSFYALQIKRKNTEINGAIYISCLAHKSGYTCPLIIVITNQ